MNIYLIIFGIVIGFLIAKYFSGEKENIQGRIKSLKIDIHKYTIHLHHWFIASIILIILTMIGFYDNLIYGILVGLIVQGLTYRDFYKIVYQKTDNNDCCKKLYD